MTTTARRRFSACAVFVLCEADVKERSRNQYSDDYRATALLLLEGQGYPDAQGALQSVADHLSIPRSTLRGWWTREHNPVPAQVRHIKKREIVDLIREEIYKALESLDNTRDFASYKDTTTSIGILVDKLQLLEGKPTERVAHEDFRSEAIEYIQRGEITYQALAEEFDHDLARELFRSANVPIEGIAGTE